jgi:hypothetical protein
LRVLATVCSWKARLAVEAGQIEDAFNDCLVLALAGADWQSCPTFIEQIVGIGLSGVARGEIIRVVYSRECSQGALESTQARLTQVYREGYPLLNLEGERLVLLDAVEHEFTDGGPGGGHHTIGAYTALTMAALGIPDVPKNRLFKIVAWPVDVAACMVHARRYATETRIEALYDQIQTRRALSPFERHEQGIGGLWEDVGFLGKLRYGMVCLLAPNEDKGSVLRFKGLMHHEATLTILALRRYHLAEGEYPHQLQELVETGYVDEVPMDVYSGKPLVYRRAGDDFILYSVSDNFTDDGGQGGLDSEGRPTAQGADWVFWPVAGGYETDEGQQVGAEKAQ